MKVYCWNLAHITTLGVFVIHSFLLSQVADAHAAAHRKKRCGSRVRHTWEHQECVENRDETSPNLLMFKGWNKGFRRQPFRRPFPPIGTAIAGEPEKSHRRRDL